MAKLKKTKNGSWHTTVFSHVDASGKRIYKSITAPTKAEAEELLARFLKDKDQGIAVKTAKRMTVGEAIEKYIGLCEVLSPTTLSAYNKVLEHAFPELMKIDVNKLTSEMCQRAINAETHRKGEKNGNKPLSAKTIKNEWGLVSSALREVCGRSYSVKLPKVQPKIRELPEADVVMAALVGTDVELPCLLALWLSFSMSEVRGLMFSDIKSGHITINRVKVDTKEGTVVKDQAKVDTRLRRHKLPAYIMDLISKDPRWKIYKKTGEDDFIITMNQKQIYSRWKRVAQSIGADMSFHDLRHLNASVMLMLNVPEKYAMERGGWKSPQTMKRVYQHTFSRERMEIDDRIDAYFEAMQENAKAKCKNQPPSRCN